MDAKFHPAISAIQSGDVERLRALVDADVTLASSRSSTNHPSLLQCLVLDGKDTPNHLAMVQILIDAGADLDGPLVACASCDNVNAAALLLDHGANINGARGWSPLEEALYWNSQRVIALLVQRGASIHNLRIAAGLGRTDLVDGFFTADGSLRAEAGIIAWPWGDLDDIETSNLDRNIKKMLVAKYASFTNDRQSIVNNAFVYACMHGHIEVAQLLLHRGAQLDAIPGGFDYSGTALHYAALNGHAAMVTFLIERGADRSIKDSRVGQLAAGWAAYGGHPELVELLRP